MSQTRAGRWACSGVPAAVVALFAGAVLLRAGSAAEVARVIPAPVTEQSAARTSTSEVAVLAGGCFWGVQGVFQHVAGVTSAVSGYVGGAKDTSHYEIVGSGRTGHAEAVRVTFDPTRISYGQILHIYFSVAHDPTQLDRQGPDVGPQYRSAIFARDAEQRRVAEGYIAQLGGAKVFGRPIVTEVDALTGFYPAEGYHQNYATLHPDNPYIRYNDLPKV